LDRAISYRLSALSWCRRGRQAAVRS